VNKRVTEWRQCLEAAQRKLDIASYHADQLTQELVLRNDTRPSLPPIPVQAHFEGIVVSLMAAVDQVAEAVNSGLGLGHSEGERREGAGRAIATAVPDVAAWYRNPLQQDLRSIRVQIVHYTYKKMQDREGWAVESVGSKYQGSRELMAYANAAIQYFERLHELIPQIQEHISEQSGEQCCTVTRRAT
jgi:hypothetical protein